MPNHLVNESSPYLLQHAHNPVNWYPWGEEALQKAASEDKPILVSIGYAACHWCHVMERESFEDHETAQIMNDRFVNIKIDREERPDLDHIYMDAVQAMSGSGGWPLNVFLTPDRKPFYGGTYYPPVPMYNRSSWKQVLMGVSDAFREKRDEIETQADYLLGHLQSTNSFGLQPDAGSGIVSAGEADAMFASIMKLADTREGGFGAAPKFPQTFTIRFLLHYHYFTGNEQALQQAMLSLDKMIDGGINDQLGGGFARYSTDEFWLAPHFEKMLYDNALLVSTLSEAYQLTGREKYLGTIEATLDFVEREMMSPESGFYAALDADSEGVEGKFYVWSKDEVQALLGADAALFCKYYNVFEKGNWEHTNILHVKDTPENFARENEVDAGSFHELLRRSKEKLLAARSKRVRPQTDDKIILGWNAMLNTAYCKAYAATGNEKYRIVAVENMNFLLSRFSKGSEGEMYHTYKDGVARYPAFLDDYAQLIHALLHLQEITSDHSYLEKVKALIKWCIAHFGDTETGYFYFTNDQQSDVIFRKKELYDGATPSGNSVMAWNLYYSGIIYEQADWRERAVKMCAGLKDMTIKYPGSFGIWAIIMQALTKGIPEIAVTGSGLDTVLKQLLRIFIPYRVLQSSPVESSDFPLLEGKPFLESPVISVCSNYACQRPVNEVSAAKVLIEELLKNR